MNLILIETKGTRCSPAFPWSRPHDRHSLTCRGSTSRGGNMATSPPTTASRSSTRTGARGQPIVFSHGWPLSADDWDTQMLFFLQHGYRVIAHDRRGHGRSDADRRRPRHGPLRRRPGRGDRPPRPARRHPRRPLHRRRRGRALHRPARREPGGQGGADQRGAADDGADRGQPGRPAEGGLRRPAGAARRQPLGVLPGAAVRPVLRLQPAGRRAVRGDHRRTGGARA